ncbi:LysR substrate-binding domain-containing protein [Cupriavidus basilensis]|uniref:Transcriptional regulator, LysR family n=1 Tax=Cupriavidus basilensis TaxID=68895 RepID=A0A0C4YJG8_9BURK|nr:LysR substrate-binding domain-containing protein [Cupriavidus basilensis]AJG23143.1 Transcriptional regulator, LysR family [Cupriavidus basilensis]
MLGDLLTTFYEVARQGSITTAAKQLRVSQPTVTGRIRQLEENYGVELFYRRAGRVDLSDVGVALMPVVEQLMQHEGSADFLLRNAGNLHLGHLRIGATGPYYILKSVAAFRERYPAIEISIDIGNSQQMLDALIEYRIDVAVSSHAVEDDRLARITLATDPMVLVVNPAHPLARAPSVSLAQLATCHLLIREHGSMTRKATETALDGAGLPLPASTVIGSREAIYEAIRRGLGASVVPLGEVPRDPALCVVPFASHPPVLHEYLYCLQGRTHTRLIGAFLDCLAPCKAA